MSWLISRLAACVLQCLMSQPYEWCLSLVLSQSNPKCLGSSRVLTNVSVSEKMSRLHHCLNQCILTATDGSLVNEHGHNLHSQCTTPALLLVQVHNSMPLKCWCHQCHKAATGCEWYWLLTLLTFAFTITYWLTIVWCFMNHKVLIAHC